MRIRWSRVLALALLLLLWPLWHWLGAHVSIPAFCAVPILGAMASDPELKALLLWGVVLLSAVSILAVLRGRA